jgi:tetratricopeptide (TPR) repeat protein
LFRKSDIPSGVKATWFGLVSVLLGPFTLWFILTAKLRRRNLLRSGFRRQMGLCAGFLAFNLFLFFAPVHWAILLGLYIAAAIATTRAMARPDTSRLFPLGFQSKAKAVPEGDPSLEPGEIRKRTSLADCMLGAALAILPLVYIVALFHNIGELENFSILLPSDVYTDGLLWMMYTLPGAALAGALAWKSGLRPGLRPLIYFYAAVAVVLGWIMVWERMDLFLAAQFQGTMRDAALFSYRTEQAWRSGVKVFFYGGAFILGVGYLFGAGRSSVFAKRTLFLGLPSLLLYANMLFALGDWNFFLAGIRERALESHHYGWYRMVAGAEMARIPAAHSAPYLLDEWVELEYQSGHRPRAEVLLKRLRDRVQAPPSAKLRRRVDAELKGLSAKAPAPATQLDLPVIKPASYLDQEWYALLSAVAFLKPKWTDLDLKKRLLDLSNTVQLHLPKLDNVPELIPALRQLEIPVSVCFLDAVRMRTALAAGKVPFLSLYGRWVPVSGYDAGRDGFYYYAYGRPTGQGWLRNDDIDLFYTRPGEAFGGEAEKARTREFRHSLQKFIPTGELEAHILDIGGVGMILGDSAFAPAAERQAAYLVELGDVYYQDHDNYQEAAAAYRKAGELSPNDQIDSRKVYLKRRYWESASDARDYQNLFFGYAPAWMERLGPGKEAEKAIVTRIMEGKLGSYLMMNWYVSPVPDSSAEARAVMDTALALFRRLHEMDPNEPLYADSLAGLLLRRGDAKGAESLYVQLAAMYPFGSEGAVYRLAWTKLKLGKVEELPALLARCKSYAEEAKYLTMRGAVSMRKGRLRSAHAALTHSLKVDKSIAETHSLLADYYRRRGDDANQQVHLRWRKRST